MQIVLIRDIKCMVEKKVQGEMKDYGEKKKVQEQRRKRKVNAENKRCR